MRGNSQAMNRIQPVASLALCLACGSPSSAAREAATETSTTSTTAAEVSTGDEVSTTTAGPMDTSGEEATSDSTDTTSTGSSTASSDADSGSTESSDSGTAESSGTTQDQGPTSCADTADVVNVWPGRAALSSELDDPILIPASFPPSSVVLAVAPSSSACADIGEYPCGQAGDAPPHRKIAIVLPPEGQEAGTYEVGWPPQSDAPAVLEANTYGFPPFCSVGGSGAGWETGVLELTSIDDISIEGVFCRSSENGATEAWTFSVNRC